MAETAVIDIGVRRANIVTVTDTRDRTAGCRVDCLEGAYDELLLERENRACYPVFTPCSTIK